MIKKTILAIGMAAALSVTAASADTFMSYASVGSVGSGLTLTSNIGGVDVYCNGKEGPKVITSTPLDLPWFVIAGMFGSWSLSCQFYPDGPLPSTRNEIGSADLDMTINSGTISNIHPYNGHSVPTIAYTADGKTGISVTLNS